MFEKILIPTDLSAETDKIFDYALTLKGLKEVIAVHTFEASAYELIKEHDGGAASSPATTPSAETRHLPQEVKRREERVLEKGEKLREAGIKFRAIVDEGDLIDRTIVELAEKENASLIIVGSHGKNPLEEVLYGSVSENVARKAKVPVLIIKYSLFEKSTHAEIAANTFNKVLFPADLSPSSDKVMDLLQLIKPKEVTLLYSVQQQEEDEKARNKKLENMKMELTSAGIKTEIVLRFGDILEDILKASEGATSVVMASNRKGILKEWLKGSISMNMARKANVPVLITHEGDVSF